MKVLLTGAAGFIGSHLAERLLALGHQVVGLDDFDEFYDPAIKERNVARSAAHENFRLVRGDILDGTLLEKMFAGGGFTHLVHLAARAGVRPSIAAPLLYQKVNVEGTTTLLEACRRSGVRRAIVASSSSVYGGNKKLPFSEDDPVDRPISPYAATKKACELIGYTYHHLYGLDVTMLRFFTVYGPRQRPDMAIHKFCRLIDEDRPVPMFGDGSSERDYTYIDDIIDGVMASIERAGGYNVYNLGESRTTRLSELIDLLAARLGRAARIEKRPPQPGDMEATFADISRARAHLDYRPRTPIEEGLDRFVAWYRESKRV